MFISYENDEIRECCLLLRPAPLNSNFSTDEIKDIRAVIADLKASPKLVECPLKYIHSKEEGILIIEYGSIKIIAEVITKYNKPPDNQIDRIKIAAVINVGLQHDLINNKNYK